MEFLFLTELVGLPVFDLKRRRLGRVRDASIRPAVDRARVDRYLVGGGWAWLTVRYDQVESISLDGLFLNDEQLTPYHDDENILRLVRDLLDQQIIDARGRKVVRVSDVTFDVLDAAGRQELALCDIDIGLRSVLRRVAQGVVPARWVRRLQGPIAPRSIPWAACNIVESDPQRRLRLNISYDFLERMHPADIADIVEELGPDEREAIFEAIDEEVAADTLSEVEPDLQVSILESLDRDKAADIIEEMEPDEAVDVLKELRHETAGEILEEMDPQSRSDVTDLLGFRDDSAGGLMSTDFLALPESAIASDARAELERHENLIESLSVVHVVARDERLLAVVPLARVVVAPADTPLLSLAREAMPTVTVAETFDRVAERFDKYNLLSLPVIDDAGRLVGVITADDIISMLRES